MTVLCCRRPLVLGLLLAVFIAGIQRGSSLEEDRTEETEEDTPESERLLAGLTWHTRAELLLVVQRLGSITGVPVPVYREDLPADYVAYWCFELNRSDYVIISSGPATGDYGLVIQGALPSLVNAVNETAASYGKTCNKFYMFTPNGEIMCRNSNGDIVATSAEDRFFPESQNGQSGKAHNDLEGRMADFRILWRRRAQRVKEEGVWEDTMTENAEKGADEKDADKAADKHPYFVESAIIPGDVIRLPVDSDTAAVHVMYVPTSSGESDVTTKTMQRRLCEVLSSCRPESGNHTRQDLAGVYSLRGVPCLDTAISKDAYSVLARTPVSMRVVVTTRSQTTIVQHYSLQMTPRTRRRTRRWTQKLKWSDDFSEKKVAYASDFPNYKQHKITWTSNKRVYRIIKVNVNIAWRNHIEERNMSVPMFRKTCNVGLGPIAWAEIFGYFDRRSHLHQSKFGSGSQGLYCCGSHATDGDPKCVAPADGSTWRLRHYVNDIAKAMKSVCANEDTAIGDSSWTPLSKMAGIKPFYASRQSRGKPRVESATKQWYKTGGNRRLQRKLMRYVRQSWPVIVGTIESNKRHYAVVTAYRYKKRRYRYCRGTGTSRCGRWRTQASNFQMYTHQGDGTNGNRWRPMDVHYVICAKY